VENSRQEPQNFIISNETQLLRYLDQHGISYRRVEHPAVFTCEEAELYRPKDDDILSAASTKNLFLCDKKGRNFYLVVTDCDKHLDLANLAIKLGERKLRFASEQKLLRYLGITRGAVTMLALINDQNKQVQLCIDSQVWRSMTYLCHPLVNTATLIISKSDLQSFFQLSGHEINLIEM
jgi:Ala-tRNA(Pro) deacylase